MNINNNKKLTVLSQNLRKNMTPEEKHLWYDFLKLLPLNVYRQKTIGNYIVDFYISCCKLVIELDGSQHCEEENYKMDIVRDNYLNEQGIIVMRFPNQDIKYSFDKVCQEISDMIEMRLK